MTTVALHTRLLAGREADYDRIHKVIPPELDSALREAGVHGWTIYRPWPRTFCAARPNKPGERRRSSRTRRCSG